jgi:hypothetical protein
MVHSNEGKEAMKKTARPTLAWSSMVFALSLALAGCAGKDGMNGKDGPKGDTGLKGDPGAPGGAAGTGVPPAAAGGTGDRTKLTGDYVVYDLKASNGSGITGIVRFAKFVDGSTLITVGLDGLATGDLGVHPAHIHVNALAKGGAAAVTLDMVDGITALSETVVSTRDDGTPITYDALLGFNGYVDAHMSPMDAAAIAGADIGSNVP